MKEKSILNSKQHKQEITIEFPNNSLIALIIGNHSANLSKLEKLIEVSINSFGNQFNITGKIEKIKLFEPLKNKLKYARISHLA